MINCQAFYEALLSRGVGFFAGVPDSLLQDICAYITDRTDAGRHIITANEGSAVALCAGHTLATGELGLVYLQNSGLGNAVNPLTSLADPDVYGIPMVLLVGWRGEPGAKPDEPQHVKMGKVTRALLEAIGVAHSVLPADIDDARRVLDDAVAQARARRAPYALVVRAGTFEAYKLPKAAPSYPMTREQAIACFLEGLEPDALVVSTTGKPSRELYEQRELRGQPHDGDFLTVGSMGHASQIALGVALRAPHRPVYCLDGDGAVIMHMGGLCTLGTRAPRNFKHVVLNNAAHESVGGQPTVGFDVDFCAIARAAGYRAAARAEAEAALVEALGELRRAEGPALVEARVRVGSRADLGRPKMSPAQLKERFMRALGREPV